MNLSKVIAHDIYCTFLTKTDKDRTEAWTFVQIRLEDWVPNNHGTVPTLIAAQECGVVTLSKLLRTHHKLCTIYAFLAHGSSEAQLG